MEPHVTIKLEVPPLDIEDLPADHWARRSSERADRRCLMPVSYPGNLAPPFELYYALLMVYPMLDGTYKVVLTGADDLSWERVFQTVDEARHVYKRMAARVGDDGVMLSDQDLAGEYCLIAG